LSKREPHSRLRWGSSYASSLSGRQDGIPSMLPSCSQNGGPDESGDQSLGLERQSSALPATSLQKVPATRCPLAPASRCLTDVVDDRAGPGPHGRLDLHGGGPPRPRPRRTCRGRVFHSMGNSRPRGARSTGRSAKRAKRIKPSVRQRRRLRRIRDPLPTLIPADGAFGRRPALGASGIRPRAPFFG